MSQIFFSQINESLQQELNARGRAGITDRSESALRYMIEKIANVSVTAYEGNKRDKNKIVHVLGGREVLTGQYNPGGPEGFLTDKSYKIKEQRWIVSNESIIKAQLESAQAGSAQTGSLQSILKENEKTYIDRSKKIPPFITQAALQVNDNTKGTTNKATISITIPNPERDLNFMEGIYARPGRYCLLRIEHPESALLTRTGSFGGMLTESALPNRKLIKERYPEADSEYDELRKMNKLQFEGVITAFEYSYNQDGTVSMTVYILGTSQIYTDMTMIMQTGKDDNALDKENNTITSGSNFYNEIYKEVQSRFEIAIGKKQPSDQYYAFNALELDTAGLDEALINTPDWYYWNFRTIAGTNPQYITLSYLINFINVKILSKLKTVAAQPAIRCGNEFTSCFSNYFEHLCSAEPENILLLSNSTSNEDPNWKYKTDMYGQKNWFRKESLKDEPFFYNYSKLQEKEKRENLGYPANILISMNLIKTIQDSILSADKKTFTVSMFLEKLSARISTATGGAINMKLVTDPEDDTILYYRDANWFKLDPVQPFSLPMYASHPNGSVIRDFKLSSKLPSNAQSLMYSINSTDKVTEDKLGPYISFMYNNGTSLRSPGTFNETVTYGGNAELTKQLAGEYFATHIKYRDQLLKAREEFGSDPTNKTKQSQLQVALSKYIQYPKPTIQQTNQVSAPTFPIEAEFTIDGINGLRYGDVLDFPVLPDKYKINTTFTIKSLTHNVSTEGEWTTQVSCMMMPKFD